jgi:hypothetical protein
VEANANSKGGGKETRQATLDQTLRIVPHNLAILARARLSFVGVDNQVLWPAVTWLVHETPLEARREP